MVAYICERCGKQIDDIRTTKCLNIPIEYEDDIPLRRIPYRQATANRCPVCHVMPGKIHHDGCPVEKCPKCGHKLASCQCKKKS